jgi:hypothetical protein
MLDSEKHQLNAAVTEFVNSFPCDGFTEAEVILAFSRAHADLIASAGVAPEHVERMIRYELEVGRSRDPFAVTEADLDRLTASNHAEPRGTVDDYSISCCLRGAYNLLSRGVETLTALAVRKRPLCRAAGRCLDTGIPMKGNEPPEAENCECNLTRELAFTSFDICGPLECVLDKADRLALIVERGPNPSTNTGSTRT